MRLARNLRLSIGAITGHRVRTGLAVGATALGVAGVLVLTALGNGASQSVAAQIDLLGGDVLIVTPAPVSGERAAIARGGEAARSLGLRDAEALRVASFAIRRTVPVVDGRRIARAGPVRSATTILGTLPEWQAVNRATVSAGRFFTHDDDARSERVAVLGADARTSLFSDTADPVGRLVYIGRIPFSVVGVLEPMGVSAGGTATQDDRILVPLRTAMRRVLGAEAPGMLLLQASSADARAAAATDAADILRFRHGLAPTGGDDFVIESQRALWNARVEAASAFRRLLILLGLLSLLVGGIGIMSVLLLEVRERRNEIGLRVAVGARRTDLLAQFLAEAMLLAGGGATAGVPVGLATAGLVAGFTAWDVQVSTATVGTAIAAALLTGVLSGVIPAWRAAGLDPIAALHAR